MNTAETPMLPADQTAQERKGGSSTLPDELRRNHAGGVMLRLYAVVSGPGASSCRRLLFRLIRKLEGGEMRSSTLRRLMQECHGVEVGAHSYGCFDPARFPIGTRIGRYVSVGPGVEIYRRNHPLDRLSLHPYFYNPRHGAQGEADVPTADLEIGADAWLGAHALVLPGCQRIGRGAVVAAGAVVTRDVPDYAVVAGNPARVLRYRFETDAIEAAENSRWWLSPPEHVARRLDMSAPWSATCRANAGGDCDKA